MYVRRFIYILLASALVAAGAGWWFFRGERVDSPPSPAAANAPLPALDIEIRAWSETHCGKCHGPARREAGIDMASLLDEPKPIRRRKLLSRVRDQLASKQMPPPDEPAVPDESLERWQAWLDQSITTLAGTALSPAERDPGPSPLRRLSSTEYVRTIRDLTGVELDRETLGFPADPVGQGFDNLAEALNVNAAWLERARAAAASVAERLVKAHGDSNSLARAIGAANSAPKALIESFARRSFRRPLRPQEADGLIAIYAKARARGLPESDALRPPIEAVLMSPFFLYRVELDREPSRGLPYVRVSDFELASRLSYFLWSSMPDEELFRAAEQGTLTDQKVLLEQAQRMLRDPKARALTEVFAAQWLQLAKLDSARPSTEFFPTFTPELKQAMRDEALQFVEELRTEDASILNLLDSDHTFMNNALASHYGLAGAGKEDLQRVALPPGSHRGGLLGMAAFLALTSQPARTSPTLRGKWVLEVILGTPPDPPPPGASVFAQDPGAAAMPKSFKEQLARHARDENCANCHQKIDPLGFGLDNYDPIGRWRESAGGATISNIGELPTGERFQGPEELKKWLLGRRSQFARNLASRMFVFALGRELIDEDEPVIDSIVQSLEQHDYHFSELVLGVVRGFPFQHRRGATKSPEEVKR